MTLFLSPVKENLLAFWFLFQGSFGNLSIDKFRKMEKNVLGVYFKIFFQPNVYSFIFILFYNSFDFLAFLLTVFFSYIFFPWVVSEICSFFIIIVFTFFRVLWFLLFFNSFGFSFSSFFHLVGTLYFLLYFLHFNFNSFSFVFRFFFSLFFLLIFYYAFICPLFLFLFFTFFIFFAFLLYFCLFFLFNLFSSFSSFCYISENVLCLFFLHLGIFLFMYFFNFSHFFSFTLYCSFIPLCLHNFLIIFCILCHLD